MTLATAKLWQVPGRLIDSNLEKARQCLNRLYDALFKEEDLTEEV
jgi:5-bromo-4-chloroindolyl phosphate hydrolysis protein